MRKDIKTFMVFSVFVHVNDIAATRTNFVRGLHSAVVGVSDYFLSISDLLLHFFRGGCILQ